MKNGTYVLLPCMRALVLDSSEALSEAEVYFGNKAGQVKFKPFISFVNRIKYFRNKKGDGKYSAIYVANNNDKNREIKLFSFETKKILTVCTSVEERNKQIEQYKKFSCSYTMPKVESSNVAMSAFEISMVELMPRPKEIFALSTIIKCAISFSEVQDCKDTVPLKDAIKFDDSDLKTRSLLSQLLARIHQSVLDLTVPVCIQHGDLSEDNLIYGSSEGKVDYWWIDWEHAKERVFFYDFFFYMLNAAFCSHDVEPLHLYLQGECDSLLKEYFAYFHLPFEREKRKDYFFVGAILFLKERVCELGNLQTLKSYCDFLMQL